MKLESVGEEDAKFLFESLKEREGIVNISHKSLPTWEEHLEFVKNHNYISWDIIIVNNEKIGNIYLTQRNEIGIFILKKFQGSGIGSEALKLFMKKNGDRRYFANIYPTNFKSIQFFGKHGFNHFQNTYTKTFD